MSDSIYAKLKLGERLSIEEAMTISNAIDIPNGIKYTRICVGDHVKRIEFADGAVFVREAVQ